MNPNQVVEIAEKKFAEAVSHFEDELKKLRTGRANPAMLDGVSVEAYGSNMPLIQVATISVPEPQLLQITPFDPSNLQAICLAIRDSKGLGLNPVDDGRLIRVQIPALNEERRKEITRQLGLKAEECMIRLRNVRHETREEIEKLKKTKEIGEDDFARFEKQLDQNVQKHKARIEDITHKKETEIMTV